MDWIRNGELPKGLRLQAHQLIPTVVHRATNPPILPPRMLHLGQLLQFAPHFFFAPSFARQARNPHHSRARRHEPTLKLEYRFRDLGLDLCADAGESQEDAVEGATHVGINIDDGAGDAAAFELVE